MKLMGSRDITIKDKINYILSLNETSFGFSDEQTTKEPQVELQKKNNEDLQELKQQVNQLTQMQQANLEMQQQQLEQLQQSTQQQEAPQQMPHQAAPQINETFIYNYNQLMKNLFN